MSNKSTWIKWIENTHINGRTNPITTLVIIVLFWLPVSMVFIVFLFCAAPLVKLLSYLGYETPKRKIFKGRGSLLYRVDRAISQSEMKAWNMYGRFGK